MKKLVLLIVLWAGFSTAYAELQPKVKPTLQPQKVLFVGNSFSYYNNGVQNHVISLIKSAGKWTQGENRYRLKTLSGGKLYEHIKGFSYLMDQPQGKGWDIVVLQGHSNEAATKKRYPAFDEAAKILVKKAREHKVEPVFFMTWPYKGEPKMTAKIRQGYLKTANQLNALVVPVGLAFAKANQTLPQLELYHADVEGFDDKGEVQYHPVEKHPSMAGTYLAACMFYAAFYQQSPAGLTYTAKLPVETARELQDVAWQTYQEFYK
ncbi:DUF4886 domain-containing protein [Neptunicella marina]|uniref:SGNH/GDSL hydrolase family protein n=1 Tax=Neptunicella marina TaxID=2125989 RepID=A0A8J6ITZ3_9ALTE|nr:DUF4886 domain-containing protein [Neptunicella marina]MBC3765581.1 hypothetical protein [Neptunicella marina]